MKARIMIAILIMALMVAAPAMLFAESLYDDDNEYDDLYQFDEADLEPIDVEALIWHGIESAREFVEEHSQVFDITSTDGYVFQGRLSMPPGDGDVLAIVIDAGTSGPNTYLMERYIPGFGRFGYWDFWAREFLGSGIAFFTANTRGVTPTDEPPDLMNIDLEGYRTYLPANVVEDVYHMIRTARENPRLAYAMIFIKGASEGAIIATLFEETHPGIADALFLGDGSDLLTVLNN